MKRGGDVSLPELCARERDRTDTLMLFLHNEKEMTSAEIGAIVGLSASEVSARLHRKNGRPLKKITHRVDPMKLVQALMSPAAISEWAVARTSGYHPTAIRRFIRKWRIGGSCRRIFRYNRLREKWMKKRRTVERVRTLSIERGHNASTMETREVRGLPYQIQREGGIRRIRRMAGLPPDAGSHFFHEDQKKTGTNGNGRHAKA